MNDKGDFIEIQGTAEGKPFSKDATNELLSLAEKGIRELLIFQKTALEELH
jgi:ribonuclease PH